MPEIELDDLLLPADRGRVERLLAAFARASFVDFAITGGLAIRAHLALAGCTPRVRPLNDLDLVVASLHDVPASLADAFIFPHVHAGAPEGRILLQLVAPDEALRVDIFCAFGETLSRARVMPVGDAHLRVASVEDLVARTTALLLGLAHGKAVDPKHARHFEALVPVADLERAEDAWRTHRRPDDPGRLVDGVRAVRALLVSRRDLLVPDVYETDIQATCPKCRDEGAFQVAARSRVLGVLGYC